MIPNGGPLQVCTLGVGVPSFVVVPGELELDDSENPLELADRYFQELEMPITFYSIVAPMA